MGAGSPSEAPLICEFAGKQREHGLVWVDSMFFAAVREFFCFMERAPRGVWVSAFFLLQLGGALGVIWLFRMEVAGMLFPLSLLLFGAICTPLLQVRAPHSLLSWHRWVPCLFYAAFIFSLSSRSFSDVSPSFSTSWFHPLEYFSLGLFLCFAWYPVVKRSGFFPFAWRVLLSGVLLSIADETLQAFVPGRYPTLLDLALDFFGLSVALGMFGFVHYLRGICLHNARA